MTGCSESRRGGRGVFRDEDAVERDEDRPGAWRAQPKEGGWRNREKAKEDSWRSGPR